MNELAARFLPDDDAQRHLLHNEVHARPSARVRLPALLTYVAVLNDGIDREQEWQHLRALPGQANLTLAALSSNFLRLRCEGFTLKWERHTEFTRYSVVQAWPGEGALSDSLVQVATGGQWLRDIPGRTMAAIQLAMVEGEIDAPDLIERARHWLGEGTLFGSRLGNTQSGQAHSLWLTHFRLGGDGFERMWVAAPAGTAEGRAGRISQRILELETYRLMALRGLPVAKQLAGMLSEAEDQLARITARMEDKTDSDEALLDDLVSLAARIERATAEHGYRFAATRAYNALVSQRIAELRERPHSGIQTVGEFMQRRLSPAMATVAATDRRLTALSERVARASALLRTRVDTATETQNRQLLEKLTRGQEMQLRLQTTVEGLSIAAISYYALSLLMVLIKAAKDAGVPLRPELTAGLLTPVVVWVVWRASRRLHERILGPH